MSFIVLSCSKTELGDGYYFLPKYESIDVGYPDEEAIVYKSNNQYVYQNIRIRGDVLEVHSNSKFIIAKRDPLINRNKNLGIIEYYIIEKKTDNLIGPLTNEKFLERIEKLRINLQFD